MSEDKPSPGQSGEEIGPVTVSVSRKVIAGRERDYEDWIKIAAEAVRSYPGHLGVNVLRPTQSTDNEYVIIYRFDSYPHLKAWETSDEREALVANLDSIIVGEPTVIKGTGLEFWFTLPDVPAVPPSPHKMALVLIVVVFCVVMAVNLLLGKYLSQLSVVARVAVVVVAQVLLMTYVVMPRVTRLLKPWLYRRPDGNK